jgi:hypothetical protein
MTNGTPRSLKAEATEKEHRAVQMQAADQCFLRAAGHRYRATLRGAAHIAHMIHPSSGDIRRSGYILGETPQTTIEPQDWGMLRTNRRRPGIAGSIGTTQLRCLGNTAPVSMSLPSRRATRITQFCRIIPSENR